MLTKLSCPLQWVANSLCSIDQSLLTLAIVPYVEINCEMFHSLIVMDTSRNMPCLCSGLFTDPGDLQVTQLVIRGDLQTARVARKPGCSVDFRAICRCLSVQICCISRHKIELSMLLANAFLCLPLPVVISYTPQPFFDICFVWLYPCLLELRRSWCCFLKVRNLMVELANSLGREWYYMYNVLLFFESATWTVGLSFHLYLKMKSRKSCAPCKLFLQSGHQCPTVIVMLQEDDNFLAFLLHWELQVNL